MIVSRKPASAHNTLVVAEHNLDVVKSADWIIGLGPEGGAAEGQIVTECRPEHVARWLRHIRGGFWKKP